MLAAGRPQQSRVNPRSLTVYLRRDRFLRASIFARDLTQAVIASEFDAGRIDFHALRVTFCSNFPNAGNHPHIVQS